MELTPREKDKLLIAMAAVVARKRLERGVKLNHPEAIALITDFDVGLEGDPTHRPVTEEEVFRVFQENNAKVKNLLFAMIGRIARDGITTCGCRGAHDSHA